MALKQHKGVVSLDDLMMIIVIEEEHRKEKPNLMPINGNTNLVMRQKQKDSRGKAKVDSTIQIKPKGKINKKRKTTRECWVCDQKGHMCNDCPKRKGTLLKHAQMNETTAQVNMAANSHCNEDVSLNPKLFTIYEPNNQ